MQVQLLDRGGKLLHQQEIIATRVPELIRWNGCVYEHHVLPGFLTQSKTGIVTYKPAVILDMPEPLPPNMVRGDVKP